ncbi:hypothetical protein SPRG_05267 [Saprolegnia parasitica CBS 223.65]|uniref:Thioredoxin domain-containing protein n=1 Tax=Saprolegnia parasitica (strain CBS 223.65) TaxID=695850 RepID=A0A067CU60_SAPPC|nr:hypothetical protein SPRG_05267 [Saprolegnia parasitica CBS 223.65]KDO30076.1 hypothetical protein SPRG_05267 [Saprolegnia parasitica CBS 223.65]|eukprot:XP_012199257.1 hypothetical protein SPRG_05267 [Saprolegnia parasitica CBS 223.65]
MARGGKGSGGASNAKELKMFMEHRMWRDHWLALSVVGSIIVALFAGFFIQFSFSEARLHQIRLDDAPLVERVFKSGEPWVVLCANADTVLPEVFDKASERLLGKMHVGVLDCDDLLPSGKSVFSKFSIRRDISPTVFTVANGEKPKQLFLNYLQKPRALAAQALAQTAKQLHEIQTTAQLDDRCLSKTAPCILVYRAADLMHAHRGAKFVWADAGILKLSVESLWPSSTKRDHRIMLFQKSKDEGGVITLHATPHTSYFEQLAVDQFVASHVAAPVASATKTLSKPVTLKRRTTKKAKAPSPSTEPSSPEVERQARARMDEESKVHFAESVDATTDAPTHNDNDNDGEEDILDLDEM